MESNDLLPVDQILEKLTADLISHLEKRHVALTGSQQPNIVGIQTGGVWVANQLKKALALDAPLGTLDISFYRDDFTENGLHPSVKPSVLPFPVEGKTIILVDDVIMSGRTVRAALNELFDYGRPSLVILVALIDLNTHQLPIQADVAGMRLDLPANERIKLMGPEPLALEVRRLDG